MGPNSMLNAHGARRPRRRRGALYISVLAVATIVAVMGFSAIHVARLHLTAATHDSDRYNAKLLAISAIEHAIAEFNTNSNWESDYTPGVEYPLTAPSIGGGTFAWKLVDLGLQQRRIEGIGRVGDARCAFQVDLGVSGTWLECGMLSGGDVTVGTTTKASDLTVYNAPVCTNSVFTNNLGTTTANVEAQVINGTVSGTQTAPAAMRALPDSEHVFSEYVVHGSPLGTTQIQRQLISPYSNPNGATNPEGIYVIDANGGVVVVRESRIVGTLVVLNATAVELRDQVNWEPARPNFPALIVQGDIRLRLVNGTLQEDDEGVNFNPVQTPYNGVSDASLGDSYPSAIAGIVYCSGNLLMDGNSNGNIMVIDGVVIANGTCTINQEASVFIEYNSQHLADPPPGFRPQSINQIQRGSWRRVPAS